MTRNLLLSGGPTHDFEATTGALVALLAADGIETTVVDHPAEAFTLLDAAAPERGGPFTMFTVNALRWAMDTPRYAHLRADHAHHLTDDEAIAVERFVRDGGALLALHAAVICFDGHPRWRALCGAAWNWTSSSHPPCGPVTIEIAGAGRDHVVTAGLDGFVIDDEVYGFLDEEDDLVPLLTGEHGGRAHPVLWARERGAGRVVTDLLGHGVASVTHPTHAAILRRAAAWLTGAPAAP